MNPSFRRFFNCSGDVEGKPFSLILDPHPFEQISQKETELYNEVVNYKSYNLTVQLMAYQLKESNQFVGIFVDLTNSIVTEKKLEEMRSETLRQARELMEHQMDMAQEMSRFLGESTAHGELLVRNLLKLGGDPNEQVQTEDSRQWLKNIFTSK